MASVSISEFAQSFLKNLYDQHFQFNDVPYSKQEHNLLLFLCKLNIVTIPTVKSMSLNSYTKHDLIKSKKGI